LLRQFPVGIPGARASSAAIKVAPKYKETIMWSNLKVAGKFVINLDIRAAEGIRGNDDRRKSP